MLEKFFKLKENGTDTKTEILAGITTFMTMAYILAVNPSILSAAGMDQGAVFTATALAALLGTLLMALFANYPFCACAGNGTECVLCIHGCTPDGVFLEGRAGSSTGRGYYLYSVITAECARGNL